MILRIEFCTLFIRLHRNVGNTLICFTLIFYLLLWNTSVAWSFLSILFLVCCRYYIACTSQKNHKQFDDFEFDFVKSDGPFFVFFRSFHFICTRILRNFCLMQFTPKRFHLRTFFLLFFRKLRALDNIFFVVETWRRIFANLLYKVKILFKIWRKKQTKPRINRIWYRYTSKKRQNLIARIDVNGVCK